MLLIDRLFRSNLIVVVLLLILVTGCKKDSSTPFQVQGYSKADRAYFPLHFGNTWKYAVVDVVGDTTNFYDYIIGDVSSRGDDEIRAILQYQQAQHTTIEYARWIDDELRVSSAFPYEEEIVWLRTPLEIGQNWEVYNYTNENLVWESYAEVIDDSAIVTTTAGTFTAVKIREIVTQHETSAPVFRDSLFNYYVKDIGCVRIVGTVENHELRFYNVQPEE